MRCFVFLLSLMLTGLPALSQESGQAGGMTCSALIGEGPLVWRGSRLEAAKTAIASGDKAILPAYNRLIAEADAALERSPISVTDKTRVPPSGDKRDYMSLAPYWWPDPSKKDGTPYIRRDGEINPERSGDGFDRIRTQQMADDVTTLTLAWYFSGEARYATAAQLRLDVFFVAEDTGMNPNLNFGQSIPGRTEGRGIGIIDTSFLLDVVDSAWLLEAGGMLTPSVANGLKTWFADYARWLVTSPLGKDERATKNNHGTYYDLQLAAFSLYAGDCALAERVIADARSRIDAQIDAEGHFPLERTRTRSFHYYIFNLEAFLKLARLGEPLGVDLYTYKGEDGTGLLDVLGILIKYSGKESQWPYEEIGSGLDEELWRLIRLSMTALDAPALEKAEARSRGRDPADRIMLLTWTD